MKCWNLCKKDSGLADELGGVEITCADYTRCEPLSTEDLYHEIDVVNEIGERVAAGTMMKVRL